MGSEGEGGRVGGVALLIGVEPSGHGHEAAGGRSDAPLPRNGVGAGLGPPPGPAACAPFLRMPFVGKPPPATAGPLMDGKSTGPAPRGR